ncbi:MAG: cyclic nucleotide-binding domain-containing protein [Anaerolineae bacterium]|nr:cyclic nucleotide-binding domain-containing protein [Anaerolineae bacterium]
MFKQEYRELSVFKDLSNNQLVEIEPFIHFRNYPQRSVIFEQGQTAEYFYILVNGFVEIIYKPYDGPELRVAHLSPGSLFGWSAALGRSHYTSAARAESDCETCCMSYQELQKICQNNPATGVILLSRFSGLIAERLSSTHDQVFNILIERMGIDREHSGVTT